MALGQTPDILLPDDETASIALCASRIESAIKAHTGLGGVQFRALALLQRAGRPLAAGGIADELMLPCSTISTCLGQLEEREFVERASSGRNVHAAITDKGTAVEREGSIACREALRTIWGLLDEDSSRTAQLLSAVSGYRNGNSSFDNGQLDVSVMTFDNVSKTKMLFKASAQKAGLTPVEARVLNCIAHASKSMGDISSAAILSNPQVTSAVGSLMGKGLATQHPSRVDKRIMKTKATLAGKDVAHRVAAEYRSRVEEYQVQATDSERAFYQFVSSKLAEHYRNRGAE